MININILTMYPFQCYIEKGRSAIDNNFIFYENSSCDIVWDVVVVYESVSTDVNIKVKKGGLWFISGEPPLSREYPKSFLQIFDLQLTCHQYKGLKNVINSQQSLDWHYCKSFLTKKNKYSLEELKCLSIPSKDKCISIISSSKRMMPGHNYRQNIIMKLKKDYAGKIDFYGGDDGNIEYKCDAIAPYKFHICIENSSIKDYWTEKFADPLLGYSVPIYAGCPNIDFYFDRRGFYTFDIKRYDSLKSIIDKVLQTPDRIYENKLCYLTNNRNLLFEKYHLFKNIIHLYKEHTIKDEIMQITISPVSSYPSYRRLLYFLRARRYTKKLILRLCSQF